jgi:hypothetical protein
MIPFMPERSNPSRGPADRKTHFERAMSVTSLCWCATSGRIYTKATIVVDIGAFCGSFAATLDDR